MRLELDEYSKFADRIRCTVKTEDGEYVFWWSQRAGLIGEAGMENKQMELSHQERIEAADRAKIIHSLIYDLNQNL